MIDKEAISETNQHISSALDDWANIMLDIEANQKAFLLHYDEKDLLNAIYIFEHIITNVGINNNTIKNGEMAFLMGKELREYVKKFTSIDTIELYKLKQ